MPDPDMVIHNGTVVTMDDALRILNPGAIAICEGVIQDVWSPDAHAALPSAARMVDAGGGLIMPGLINAHTHLPMSLFRGLADDMALDQWLNAHIFPAEAAHVTPDSVKVGARLSLAEMLLGGTTTCCDGYFLASHTAPVVVQSGMRAILGQGVIDFPAPGVPDPEHNVDHAVAFADSWSGRSDLLAPAIFCHAPYTCSRDTLRRAKAAASARGLLFQIHVAETAAEVEQCSKTNGCSPVRYLHRLGLLDGDTLLVHAVWLDDADIDCIADSGAHVVHCPESNMKLASGVAPLTRLMEAGIACGLGTDGCASNNDLCMFGEMRSAALLQKVHKMDPTVLDAARTLAMATRDGARALGLDDAIGTLAPGKRADVITLGLRAPHMTPLYHPASHLVYAASCADVRQVVVDGNWVVRDGILRTMDLEAVMADARQLARAIGQH